MMEVPCSTMVQVGFPSAPYRAMSQSPTPSPLPLCPQMHVEGEEPPACETLLCSVFLSLFPYTPAKPSVQPLSLSSAPFADPFLLQKLMSLPVHVTWKGAAGRDRDVRCVSCTEDAPTSQSLAAFLTWSFGKGPGTAQGRAGFVPGDAGLIWGGMGGTENESAGGPGALCFFLPQHCDPSAFLLAGFPPPGQHV